MNRKALRLIGGRVGWAALCAAGAAVNGCALAPVAALGVAGNVADIGNAAFTTGTEVFSAGELESVEFATFEHAQAAVRSTLRDLRLRLRSSALTKKTAHYAFVDDADADVSIDLKVRSPAICQMRVDVGMFGSEAYARLLLKSIRARLPIVARQSATQPTPPVGLDVPREFNGLNGDDLDR